MSTEQLKPCPFCGGMPTCRKVRLDERFAYAERVTYSCEPCGLSLGATGDTSKGGYADNSKVEAMALAAWNRRAPTGERHD